MIMNRTRIFNGDKIENKSSTCRLETGSQEPTDWKCSGTDHKIIIRKGTFVENFFDSSEVGVISKIRGKCLEILPNLRYYHFFVKNLFRQTWASILGRRGPIVSRANENSCGRRPLQVGHLTLYVLYKHGFLCFTSIQYGTSVFFFFYFQTKKY